MDAKYLKVSAMVRYWEDATVNGMEDTHGDLIPFRKSDLWEPVIDLELGVIVDWPDGVTADIHYKVCDAGEYWLLDEFKNVTGKWSGEYVPNRFLCHGDNGYGDYIIMKVGADGKIDKYAAPHISENDWRKEA